MLWPIMQEQVEGLIKFLIAYTALMEHVDFHIVCISIFAKFCVNSKICFSWLWPFGSSFCFTFLYALKSTLPFGKWRFFIIFEAPWILFHLFYKIIIRWWWGFRFFLFFILFFCLNFFLFFVLFCIDFCLFLKVIRKVFLEFFGQKWLFRPFFKIISTIRLPKNLSDHSHWFFLSTAFFNRFDFSNHTDEGKTLSVFDFPDFFWAQIMKPIFAFPWQILSTIILTGSCYNIIIWYILLLKSHEEVRWFISVENLWKFYCWGKWIYKCYVKSAMMIIVIFQNRHSLVI